MRILRNISFLYLSLACGFILNFVQLKILSVYLPPHGLGEFFTINAFGQILSGILLLGAPFVLVRYVPKFEAEKKKRELSSLLSFFVLSFFSLSVVVYTILYFVGHRLGIALYHSEIIGKNLSLGFVASSAVTFFWLVFMAFNGLRKMSSAALLNILYLILLTGSLILFRHKLSVTLVLRIYLFSVIPSIGIGLFLLHKEVGRIRFQHTEIIKEISYYWKYAIFLGVLSPLLHYLDRLIIGCYLTMPMVAIFTVASRIKNSAARVLDIPIQAVTPEMSYSWEEGRKKVIGSDLSLVVKLYFFATLVFATSVLVGCKDMIQLISTAEYAGAAAPLGFLMVSAILSSLYAPIATAMRAIGKISLQLISNIVWVCAYVALMLIFLGRFGIVGVGIAHLLATVATLLYNFLYVVRYHTELRVDFRFLYKMITFGTIFGLFTCFVWQYAHWNLIWRLVILFLFVALGYLLFLSRGNLFSNIEKKRMRKVLIDKYPLMIKLFT
jgi:O-antigen/teichoic acid export membrane protein